MNHIANDNKIEYKLIEAKDNVDKIRQLFLEYSKSLGIDLNFQDFETEVNSLPGKYVHPDGALVLVSVNGKAAGCVGLRKLSEDTCEMKRLYIRDEYRGLGIGKKLITMIITEAKKLNYSYVRLDTLPTMKKAQELYISLGFYDIEPYVYNPIEGTRFLECKLEN